MELQAFLQLPATEVARLVRAEKPRVCVFPINGTRRWFILEHGSEQWEDPVSAYMDVAGENHIGLYKLFFEHGIDTLLTPIFGPDILLRGEEYVRRIGAAGLVRLARHPAFAAFYEEYDVRVHFYGDYRRLLNGTEYAYLADVFDETAEKTRRRRRFRLFFGVFANDATQAVAEFSARHFQQHGRVPEKKELVQMYYGEDLEPVDLFIGFDRFSAFDMPLLATGAEDLYFTISPSPYLSAEQLRRILYDHLYTRCSPEPEYGAMPAAQLQDLRAFYAAYQRATLGTGRLLHGVWVPELFGQADDGPFTSLPPDPTLV